MGRGIAGVLAAGALSGVLTELAIAHRPFYLLAVFAGVWVVAASWLGRRAGSPKAAAVHSTVFLVGMVCAFYSTVMIVESQLRLLLWIFWLAVALTGGPLLGLAGHLAGTTGPRAGLAAAGLAGLLIAESVRVWLGFGSHYRWAYVVFNLMGTLLVLSWPQRNARWITAAALVPALAAGLVVFTAIPVLVYGGSHLPFEGP